MGVLERWKCLYVTVFWKFVCNKYNYTFQNTPLLAHFEIYLCSCANSHLYAGFNEKRQSDTPSAPVFVVIHLIFLELFLCDSPKSQRQHNNWSLKHRVTADCSDSICFLTPVLSSCRFQSKDIGIQMHEELVKVTNELYTVSNRLCLLQIDLSHLISSLSSPKVLSPHCLPDVFSCSSVFLWVK